VNSFKWQSLWSFGPYKPWLWLHIARETENLNTEKIFWLLSSTHMTGKWNEKISGTRLKAWLNCLATLKLLSGTTWSHHNVFTQCNMCLCTVLWHKFCTSCYICGTAINSRSCHFNSFHICTVYFIRSDFLLSSQFHLGFPRNCFPKFFAHFFHLSYSCMSSYS
jgi:hypothetical protein